MNEGSLPWWTPRAVLTCVMKRRLSGAIAAVNRILPVHARSVPGPARPLLRQNRTQRPQQRDAAAAEVRQEIILGKLLALPQQRYALGHERRDEIRLQFVPAPAVAFLKERIAGLVRIAETEVADEALVVVVLDVLQRGLRHHVAVGALLLGVTEEAQREAEVVEAAAVAARDGFGGIEGLVLPGAVRVGRAQYFVRAFQLLGALHEAQRRASAVEAIPVGYGVGDVLFREPIGLVHEARVADAERAVPIIRHAVVA